MSNSTKWLPSEIDLCANRIEVVSNFKLLGKIGLKNMVLINQLNLLKHHSILPINYRFFYRLCILSYYVVNNIILSKLNLNLLRNSCHHFSKSFKSFAEPVCRTKKGSRRLTNFSPKILNNVFDVNKHENVLWNKNV